MPFQRRPAQLPQLRHSPAAALGELAAAEEKVKQAAKDGKGGNGQGPGQLVVRVSVTAHNGQHSKDTDKNADKIELNKVGGKPPHHHHQQRQLEDDEHADNGHTVGQQPGNAAEQALPFAVISLLRCLFAHTAPFIT